MGSMRAVWAGGRSASVVVALSCLTLNCCEQALRREDRFKKKKKNYISVKPKGKILAFSSPIKCLFTNKVLIFSKTKASVYVGFDEQVR